MLEVPFKENFGDRYTIGGDSMYDHFTVVWFFSILVSHIINFSKTTYYIESLIFGAFNERERTKLWSLRLGSSYQKRTLGTSTFLETNKHDLLLLKSHFRSIQWEGSIILTMYDSRLDDPFIRETLGTSVLLKSEVTHIPSISAIKVENGLQ